MFIRLYSRGGDKLILKSDWPTDEEMKKIVSEYGSMLYKIAVVILCDPYDAEDVVQDTFLKYITKHPRFNDDNHKRAWLIRVAVNIAKDKKSYNLRHQHLDFDSLEDFLVCKDEYEDELDIPILLELPVKYRRVLYLHYIEELSVNEISEIEAITVFAVKHRLHRGRSLLKKLCEVKRIEEDK